MPAAKATRCTINYAISASPGIGTKSGEISFQNTGPGVAKCNGAVAGAQPTGAGSLISDTGTATGSCAGGKGEFTGDTMDGSFSVLPKKGNCVTAPVTEMTADLKGTLK